MRLTKRSPRFRPSAVGLLVLAMMLACSCLAMADQAGRTLAVGAYDSPPFVVRGPDGQVTGLSVDVWRAAASRTGVKYKIVMKQSGREALRGVETGELDVAIGPIGVTSQRVAAVSFTQPYFHSNLAILSPLLQVGRAQQVRPVLRLLGALGVEVAIFLLLMGTVVWLSGRRRNGTLGPLRGIAAGVRMVLTTLPAGGDPSAPDRTRGRILACLWMLMAVMLISTLAAAITSLLTLSNGTAATINTARDLARKRVAVLAGSTAETYVHNLDAIVVPTASSSEALSLLAAGRVEAVVGDQLVLRYYMNHASEQTLSLVPASFDLQNYGFVLRHGDPLVRRLNVTLLGLGESDALDQIRASWVSPQEASHP